MRWRVFIILILINTSLSSAQTLDDCFKLGEHHLKQGNAQAALSYFQRVLFFDEEQRHVKDALLKTANCFYNLGEYHKAASFYLRLLPYCDTKEKKQVSFHIVGTFLLATDYHAAFEELLNLEYEINDEADKINFHFLRGTAYLGMNNINNAQEEFQKVFKNDDQKLEAINKQFAKLKRSNNKSEHWAYFMSAAIPGLGQMYAHDYRNGINVFLLSSGFLALGIYTATNFNLLSALVNVMPWWSRYHIGGMNRTKESVEKYKQSKRHNAYLKIVSLYQTSAQE